MNRKIAVVGLGYVGLPVAVEFGKKHEVLGYDINKERIESLINGVDNTNEVTQKDLASANITFTSDPTELSRTDFIIVSVPTPINEFNQPDLSPLLSASKTVGRFMKKDSIVVYESTVYPGATEEECVPILEEFSGLKSGKDFFVGYSPERINPGDKIHTFASIKKVVSGQTDEITEIIAEVYGSVVSAGIHKASSIKVAEAAKVIENTQRDLNIALMNELALIFEKMDIDTVEVLEAAGTKWNFLNFRPGLVGGHCIGVDPYYLTHKAERVGYHPEVILAGRRTNNEIGKFAATTLVKKLIKNNIEIQGANVVVLGLTFKENVPDLRNSKVIDIIDELEDYGINVYVNDSMADSKEALREYGINLTSLDELENVADAVVLAVPHEDYLKFGWNCIERLLKSEKGIVIDVKSKLNKAIKPEGITLWRL